MWRTLLLIWMPLNCIYQKLPSLIESDAESLKTPLALLELKEPLCSMQKGKSPGHDGLPPEFFLELWYIFGPLLLNSVTYAC